MIVLKHGKFISGARIFSAGAILPDNVDAQKLITQGLAEVVADAPKKAAKSAKKLEPEPIVSEQIVQENAQVNS